MSDLSTILRDYQNIIDQGIDYYLPVQGELPPVIHEAMRYSALSSGKRIRPILTLETVKMLAGDSNLALPSAVAIELAHCFTLIHDDLPSIDNDELRRGIATSHVKYGEGMALLAGDALLVETYRIISNFQQPRDVIADVVAILSNALSSNGVIGGQVTDILAEKEAIKHNYENLQFLHTNKTAKLIQATVLIGATIAQANKEVYNELSEASLKIGLAFQIRDDILDVVGEKDVIGKNIGRDKELGKLTYVKLFGVEKAEEKCMQLLNDAIALIKPLKNSTALIKIFKFLVKREF